MTSYVLGEWARGQFILSLSRQGGPGVREEGRESLETETLAMGWPLSLSSASLVRKETSIG